VLPVVVAVGGTYDVEKVVSDHTRDSFKPFRGVAARPHLVRSKLFPRVAYARLDAPIREATLRGGEGRTGAYQLMEKVGETPDGLAVERGRD